MVSKCLPHEVEMEAVDRNRSDSICLLGGWVRGEELQSGRKLFIRVQSVTRAAGREKKRDRPQYMRVIEQNQNLHRVVSRNETKPVYDTLACHKVLLELVRRSEKHTMVSY